MAAETITFAWRRSDHDSHSRGILALVCPFLVQRKRSRHWRAQSPCAPKKVMMSSERCT